MKMEDGVSPVLKFVIPIKICHSERARNLPFLARSIILRFVIPSKARNLLFPARSVILRFVIPSESEESAVPGPFRHFKICHSD